MLPCQVSGGTVVSRILTAYQPVDRAVTVVAGPLWMEREKYKVEQAVYLIV